MEERRRMRRYTGIQKMSTRVRVEVGEIGEMRMKRNSSSERFRRISSTTFNIYHLLQSPEPNMLFPWVIVQC